jgi:hypothetical protein
VDSTDFYMFMSYEPGQEGYVTLIANYVPLQDAYGGPNYFALDQAALYEIHIDNDGDAREDLTFQFRFDNDLANDGRGLKLPIGPSGDQTQVAVPLKTLAWSRRATQCLEFPRELFAHARTAIVVAAKTLRCRISRAARRASVSRTISSATRPSAAHAAYEAYARQFIYDVNVPGCSQPACVRRSTRRTICRERARSSTS